MKEFFITRPYLVAIIAGVCAQLIKVISFIILEKRVNYKRFVQPDGSPNMHSAAMTALALYVGFIEGFTSVVFALTACLTIIVTVDMWNVKQAYSRQQEVVLLLIDRWSKNNPRLRRSRKALSYTPMDVLSGTTLGIVITMLLV